MSGNDVYNPEREYEERRQCLAHEGMNEKTKGLQGQITTRLNLQTWLLGIIILIMLSGMSYLSGALGSHDKLITRVQDRQDTMVKHLELLDSHYENLEARVDVLGRGK